MTTDCLPVASMLSQEGKAGLLVPIHFALEPPGKPESHGYDKAYGEQAEQSDVSGEEFFEHDVHG